MPAIDTPAWAAMASLALIASLLPLHPSRAAAPAAPDWMHAVAAAPVPGHDADLKALRLLSDTTVTVRPDGRIVRLSREVFRILRTDGEDRGVVTLDYSTSTPITRLRGWCIPAQGKDFEVRESDAIDSAMTDVENGELVSDSRRKTLKIPAALPGNVVGFEFEQTFAPYELADEWEVQDTVPTVQALYALQLPPGWTHRAAWIHHGDVAAVSSTGQWHWQVADEPAVKIEPNMPPWKGIAGRLSISLIPPPGKGAGWASWQTLGAWFFELLRGRSDVTPEMHKKVAELTASEATPVGRIRAIARFVQVDVRYVAIELGIGGHRPHPAAEVFAHRYGDCKDKANLLRALLGDIGVDSALLVINTERGAVTADTPANLLFNHAVLAIRLPPEVHDAALTAVLTDARPGPLLFFDPTDEVTPFGRLRGQLQANTGLLVTAEGGELVTLPQLAADSSGVARTAKFVLDDKGTLQGDVDEVMVGDPASRERRRLQMATQELDRVKPIEATVGQSLAQFEIKRASIVTKASAEAPFEWRYSFQSADYAKATGDLLLVRPRVLGSHASGMLETKEARRSPVEFDGPERDTDTVEIVLPANYVADDLPGPVDVDYDFASYHSTIELQGHVLRYTRTFEIKQVSVPAGRSDELKSLYRTIYGDERRTAVFRKQT